MNGISLGWNCQTASHGVEIGARSVKAQGYKTCPFDEMLSNQNGVVLCLSENFKQFTDPEFLDIVEIPSDSPYCAGDRLIRNRRYKFLFNHESPGHANLQITQNWEGGINHQIQNNYEKFRERQNRRIDNFRDIVLKGGAHFLITYPNHTMDELHSVLNTLCPTHTLTRFDIQNQYHQEEHMRLMGA